MFARVSRARPSPTTSAGHITRSSGLRSFVPQSTYNIQPATRSFSSSLKARSAQVVNHIQETKKHFSYPELDVDETYVPHERLGVNFKHNWSLAPLQVHPAGDSYCNLDVSNLMSRSFGKQADNKALVVDAKEENTPDALVTPDPREHDLWPDNVEDLDPKFARRVWKEVSYYLSQIPHSFVRDSVTSSSVSGSVSARVVSDNAVSDLFLANMMMAKPNKSTTNTAELVAQAALERGDEEEIQRLVEESIAEARRDRAQFKFNWNVTLLNAPGYRFELDRIVEEFGGPRPTDLGLKKPHFTLADPVKRMAIVAGVYDNVAAMEALAYLTARQTFQEHGSFLFPADIVFTDGKATMIIGNDMQDSLGLRGQDALSKLYSAHHSIWAKDGLSKVWDGVSLESKQSSVDTKSLSKGVLVEELAGNKTRVTRKLAGVRPNVIKHPSSVILAVEDASSKHVPDVSLLEGDIALQTMISGLKQVDSHGKPEFSLGYTHNDFNTVALPRDMAAALQGLLSASPDTKVYVVNKSSANAKKLVADIASGQLPSLKPVSKVKGWSASPNTDGNAIASLASAITSNFAEAQKLE